MSKSFYQKKPFFSNFFGKKKTILPEGIIHFIIKLTLCHPYTRGQLMIDALKEELTQKEADLQKLTWELSNTYEELVLLYDFNKASHSVLDPDEIAQLLLELAVNSLPVKHALYLLPSEDGKEFTIKFHHGIDEKRREDYKVRVGKGAIGKSIESGKPNIICDINTRSELNESGWGWKHLLSCPLRAKDKVVGVLVLADKISGDAFLSSEQKLMSSLASIAAYVIENAEMYQALEESYKTLKSTQNLLIQTEKLATVGQISAGVAHEINNPLTAIIGYSQLILMTMPKEDRNRKRLEIMEQEAMRCAEIASNLLSFSRQQREQKAPLDINGCLAETLAIIEYQVTKNDINIIKEFDSSLPFIEANANQLMQVFLNLIHNASHAMPDGGRITIRTGFDGMGSSFAASHSYVIAEIADTGCGIPQKDIPHLFEPFFTTKEKGTGLGLYISHGIIKEHNGEVLVKSSTEEGMSGTKFTVKLPIGQL